MKALVAWSLAAGLLTTGAAVSPPWVERVFEHVQAGRERAGSAPYERRGSLDEAAGKYAAEIAGRPHAERLRQQRSIGEFLEANGIERFHQARVHLDMGKGYRDWGDKFSRSWTAYGMAWESVTDARYDAMGLASATGDDGWVVLAAIFVDDLKIPTDLEALERQTLEGVNEIRVEAGLQRLKHHAGLVKVARAYSERMLREDFFAHVSPDGGTLDQRARLVSLTFRSIAENLHKSKGYDDPVPNALSGWMDSRGHRENILGAEYTHSAVGVAVSEDGYVYFTQLFLLP